MSANAGRSPRRPAQTVEEREREAVEATAGRLRFMRGDSLPALSTGQLPQALESALAIHLRALGTANIPYYDAQESRIQPGESFERGSDPQIQRPVEYKWSPVGPGGTLVRVVSDGALESRGGALGGPRPGDQLRQSPTRQANSTPLPLSPSPTTLDQSTSLLSAAISRPPAPVFTGASQSTRMETDPSPLAVPTASTSTAMPHSATPERSLPPDDATPTDDDPANSSLPVDSTPSASDSALPTPEKGKKTSKKAAPTRAQPRRSARASLPAKFAASVAAPSPPASTVPIHASSSTANTRSRRRASENSATISTPPPPRPTRAAKKATIIAAPPSDSSELGSEEEPGQVESAVNGTWVEDVDDEVAGALVDASIAAPITHAPVGSISNVPAPSTQTSASTKPSAPAFLSPSEYHGIDNPGVRKYAKASNATAASTEGKLECPNAGCDRKYSQPNGLKYHLKHGRCNVPGTESFVEEMKGKPHLCHLPKCGKRYKNRNGLRYHYEHCGPHGVVGMQLFAEDRHPAPEGSNRADSEDANNSHASSASTAPPAASDPSAYRSTSRSGQPKRVVSTALPLSKIPPSFNDTLLAAQGVESRRPLLARLDHLCERIGITRAGQSVVCLFCTEVAEVGQEYQWPALEKHLVKQHGFSFERYCNLSNAERKEVKEGLALAGNLAPSKTVPTFQVAMLPNPFAPVIPGSASADLAAKFLAKATTAPKARSAKELEADANQLEEHKVVVKCPFCPATYDGRNARNVLRTHTRRKHEGGSIIAIQGVDEAVAEYDSGEEDAMGSDDEELGDYTMEMARAGESHKRQLDDDAHFGYNNAGGPSGLLPGAKRARLEEEDSVA